MPAATRAAAPTDTHAIFALTYGLVEFDADV
jgi:hypothetical protein